MNFINRLQGENAELRNRIEAAAAELMEFRAFLASSKFVGVDLDGARKDWIATKDVDSRLTALLDTVSGGL